MEILSLGEKLKRRRKELNMTLKDLAGDRITPGQISLVESGKSNPSMDLLEYLASALNVTVEYLMESEETQAENICTYYENMAEACILSKSYLSAEQYVEKVLFYAEKYNLKYRKAKNLYLRGIIYMEKSEIGLAQQFFLSANVIFITENCFEDIVNTFLKLGIISLNTKSYHSSYSYFKQAEKVFMDNNIGNDFLLGKIYYYMAYTYQRLEKHEDAINYAFLAKEKFRQLEEKKDYAMSIMLLAKQYSENGDIDNAIKYSKKTLNIFKEINDCEYIADIENNLGKLFYEFQNYEESFIHLNKSKELRKNSRDLKLSETLVSLCENYIKLKDADNAKVILEEMIEIIGNGNHEALIDYYMLKYKVCILDNDLKEAENTLIMALNFVNNMGYRKHQAEISLLLGKFYIENGQDKEAARFLSEGVETLKQLGVFEDIN
ncbi:helix-turn-helix transcriptional regulator [Clostridium sp. SYSU_GA19001]|uniref:helix-turn-helix domain-containing protein n=1 Tax=Clostridium caldaquaticum TaxID=2940653 RepID=UPI0020770B9D|nr:helix-turn-helix transcriptional regulator [Clostridium caldaquaticum]MCM8711167.1 helix-turn-helix transcriptional regulator [Clostridium caldaquaticum]